MDLLYERLAGELRDQIASGVYRAGERLPGVRALSRTRSVSVATVLAAYRRLEDDAGPVEELVALHAAVLPAFNLADGGSRLLLPDALAVQLGG